MNYPPISIFSEIEDGNKLCCGPLFQLLKQISIYKKSGLNLILAPKTEAELLFNAEDESMNMLMFPLPSSQAVIDLNITIASRFLGFTDSAIATRKYEIHSTNLGF